MKRSTGRLRKADLGNRLGTTVVPLQGDAAARRKRELLERLWTERAGRADGARR